MLYERSCTLILSQSSLKQLLWENLTGKSFSTWKNWPKHCIFADFLLISDEQKELLIASFVELFKNANLEKPYR